ncbi:MAG: Flp pilus assembly complex ATPase component TadA [Alphaproteobacteria bacterium]|jgi:type II secretory ATPase GspE/PulE/Tfp pilus assembly ATPase PilB-like protein|nr:Flp pilus assembly complex ATPase component TadA [Alphaproteobacteria bacterium]
MVADKNLDKETNVINNGDLSVSEDIATLSQKEILERLFYDGNTLLTATGEVLGTTKDTQNLLAYFSGGEIVISRTHRYDGRVIAFLELLKKEKRSIKEPLYTDLGLISVIYRFNKTKTSGTTSRAPLYYDNRMQKNFVDIIARAASMKVSDIHIEVADQTTIYFRIDGSIQSVLEYSSEWGESFIRAAFASADQSSSNYAQNEYQSAQKDGRTPLRGTKDLYLPAGIMGVRMQFNPIAFGSRYVVMRLLYDNPADTIKTEQEFGEYERNLLMRLRSFPTGLVVVAGPTSSGKSTTLFQNMSLMLKERNYEINLITIEDPAERKIFGSHQIPVVNVNNEEQREDKFTEALQSALRSDPDVLMVGEIRTSSAAQLTVKGALSGHAVWTTLHANSAMAALTRLLDIGVESFKLKDETMMRGLISMRLFKKLCPYCRKKILKSPEHPAYKRVLDAFGKLGLSQIYFRGDGCEHCSNKGTVGRIKAGEIIITDNKFLELTLSGKTSDAVKYWIEELDGRTLKEAAMELMLSGIIGVEELERWVGLLDQPSVY